MPSTLRQLAVAAGPVWAAGLATGALFVRAASPVSAALVVAAGAALGCWLCWRQVTRPQRGLARIARQLRGGRPTEPQLATGVLDELAADLDALARTIDAERRFFEERVQSDTRTLRIENARKDDILANTAHELRTPLTTVQASLDILAGFDDLGTEDAAEFLNQARIACGHMLFLLNDLVDQAAVAAGRLSVDIERHHVVDLLEDIETLIRPLVAAHGLGFEIVQPQGDPEVFADRGRTLQVLFNLLGNAVKYTTDGPGPIRLVVTVRSDTVHFAVLDRGIGIPDGQRHRLFTRFGRVHGTGSSAPSGTGIGLHLCAVLVERMGGRVGYSPRDDGPGSEFWFELRLAAATARPGTSAAGSEAAEPAS